MAVVNQINQPLLTSIAGLIIPVGDVRVQDSVSGVPSEVIIQLDVIDIFLAQFSPKTKGNFRVSLQFTNSTHQSDAENFVFTMKMYWVVSSFTQAISSTFKSRGVFTIDTSNGFTNVFQSTAEVRVFDSLYSLNSLNPCPNAIARMSLIEQNTSPTPYLLKGVNRRAVQARNRVKEQALAPNRALKTDDFLMGALKSQWSQFDVRRNKSAVETATPVAPQQQNKSSGIAQRQVVVEEAEVEEEIGVRDDFKEPIVVEGTVSIAVGDQKDLEGEQ